MTREDIRAQLAKNPLVWRNYPIEDEATTLRVGTLRLCYSIRDGMLRSEVYHKTYGTQYQQILARSTRTIIGKVTGRTLERFKTKAEAHRLDLICEMLGITE